MSKIIYHLWKKKDFINVFFSQMACCDSLKYDFSNLFCVSNILEVFTTTKLNLLNYNVCPLNTQLWKYF